jgi:hypothetical protein
MIDRDDAPLLRHRAELPDLLREALESATDDELPGRARMSRIQGQLDAAIATAREAREQAPSPRISGWQPAAARRHVRFAGAKIGLAALVGMGVAWSSVEGYRIYQQASERTASERRDAAPAIETGTKNAKPVAAPSRHALDADPAPSVVSDPEPVPIAPPVVARPEPRMASKRSSVPRSAAESSSPNVATPPPPLVEEDLLERATQALRRDPGEALALADEHARAFPSGRMAQEREVVAIQALSKLGRNAAARTRARSFLEQYPHSAYANDVLRLMKSAGG